MNTSPAPGIDPRPSFSNVAPRLQIAWDSVSSGAAKKCARYYQLSILEGWRSKRESLHLRYGILYHRAGEVYDHKRAEGMSHDDALLACLWDLRDGCLDWSEVDCETCGGSGFSGQGTGYGDVCADCGGTKSDRVASWWNPEEYLSEEAAKLNTKTIPNLFRTVIWYLDQHKNDVLQTVILANGKPAVELSFRYELGYTFENPCPNCTGERDEQGRRVLRTMPVECETCGGSGIVEEELMHSGHLDKLAKMGELTYVVDKKTTKNTIGDGSSSQYFKQFSPSNQMTGYTFAGKVALSEPIHGVIIDAAQIAKGFSRFARGFANRTDAQLDEWRMDFIELVQRFARYAELNYYPMNDTACDMYGGCAFRDICTKDPRVRQMYLESNFTRKPWDPLEVRGDI